LNDQHAESILCRHRLGDGARERAAGRIEIGVFAACKQAFGDLGL